MLRYIFSTVFLLTLSLAVYIDPNPQQGQARATQIEVSTHLAFEPVISGLANPVALTHAGDSSDRLFITLQAGQVLIYDGTQVLPTPFLDITPLVSCCDEQGLLSVAFHPAYASNGFFYVNYTDRNGNTVVARYAVSADPNVADPNSAFPILMIQQPFSNHNGGQLQFGPDGLLYIGTGDGGSAGDPQNNAQNLGTLLGKILRIDVDEGVPYAIPPDNPFVGIPGARGEIWALGLRNPWRFSFDRSTGELFIGDVGQNEWEEIDFQPATSSGGENYGWRLMEGSSCFTPPLHCNDGTLTLPILEYNHFVGCAVTGGYRYRGVQIPHLFGTYVYGDLCSGRIWGAGRTSDESWHTIQLFDTDFTISTFGEDEDGEMYFAHYDPSNGAIYRFVGPPSEPCPLAFALEDVPQNESKLGVLYDFRNDVLAGTPMGQHYIELFYEHAAEGSRLLVLHPSLYAHTRTLLERFLPQLRRVVDGGEVTVTHSELTEIEVLLDAFAVHASSNLRTDLRAIQKRLWQEGMLQQFGIRIVPKAP